MWLEGAFHGSLPEMISDARFDMPEANGPAAAAWVGGAEASGTRRPDRRKPGQAEAGGRMAGGL